ncbi:hypothetical protein [Novosphingobium ginsenosidimutans]|jgi:hypothetical protein|uniref:Uncharacterized protein n=1 Tax=Novosphingobium ginsenosidimutans TaxID=1176536 RepID=A0A5B8S6D7_9SPHN|nr:hypothetical protein [Novosphingobium ginsenosidimutans]QEA15985.1 hypothetical protein FRF71_07480 [Novosphingobium ginsenosidimutans]
MGSKNNNDEHQLCQLLVDLDACLNLADNLQLPLVAISICEAADKVRAEIRRVNRGKEHSGASRNVN